MSLIIINGSISVVSLICLVFVSGTWTRNCSVSLSSMTYLVHILYYRCGRVLGREVIQNFRDAVIVQGYLSIISVLK